MSASAAARARLKRIDAPDWVKVSPKRCGGKDDPAAGLGKELSVGGHGWRPWLDHELGNRERIQVDAAICSEGAAAGCRPGHGGWIAGLIQANAGAAVCDSTFSGKLTLFRHTKRQELHDDDI